MVIQKILKHPLFYIFILALILRIYKLGEIPDGFHVDEVRVGWNAYSILKTGMDDWGKSRQLHYNSFGDFRPMGIFYLTIPSIAIFGLTEFATRFPSALVGALTILPIYFFVRELFESKIVNSQWSMDKKKKLTINYQPFAIAASFMLAINPWHISLSRATSEGIISVFLVISAIYFLLNWLTHGQKRPLLFSFFSFFASYFFYHSARMLSPIFALVTLYIFRKSLTKKIDIKIAVIFVLVLIGITFIFSLNKEARGRFSQVSIFNDLNVKKTLDQMPYEEGENKVLVARIFHNKLVVYTTRFIDEYAKYFSSNFLISTEGKPIRYVTVGNGLLTYTEFALLAIGLISIFRKNKSLLPLILLLVAPLPAALTTEDAPNLHRAVFMIPFLSIIIAYGLFELTQTGKYQQFYKIFLLLIFANLVYFSHMYFVHNRVHEQLSMYRNRGVKETINSIESLKDKYDKIQITNIPDDLYPWYAFYTKQNPTIFNEKAKTRDKGAWSFGKIIFGQIKCPSRDVDVDYQGQKMLVIDSESCGNIRGIVPMNIILEIKRPGPEGGIPYTFWGN